MAIAPVFYAEPTGERLELETQPRLASWNSSTHPDQVRLTESLACAARQLEPTMNSLSGALALRLDVGLPDDIELLTACDLDNYAYPLAAYLGKTTTATIASVWSSKQTAAASFVGVDAATPIIPADDASYQADIHTTASGSTEAYKRAIQARLLDAAELPDGAVSLEIAFVVGPRRNWLNLWKPTIDALEPLLGQTRPGRPWNPKDGRITLLGLHRTIDPSHGNDLGICLRANSIGS